MRISIKISMLLVAIASITAFVSELDPVAKIIEAVGKNADAQPQEKVFLHTDKPYYSAGDTIWYKSYVVEAEKNQPTTISSVVNVDLIDFRDSVVASQKIKLSAGLGNAQIVLPVYLKSGDYTLYAYTNWMRNNDQAYFFKKKLVIANPFSVADKKSQKNADIAVDFFPEGGDLIAGIRSIVAFKAISKDGLGNDISGVIQDQNGNKVLDFASTHLGMGAFAIVPEIGKVYSAVFNNGKKELLPIVKTSGYVLSVVNRDQGGLGVKVVSSANQPAELILVLQQNGKIKYMSKVTPSPLANITIPEQKFQTGIVQVTLFKNEVPIAERLAFVDRYTNLQFLVSTDKPIYQKQGKTEIEVTVTDSKQQPVTGSFSVSVVDASKVVYSENAENNILSNLLLTSDLRGNIENPGYYFDKNNALREKHLDLLLMTQGWRRFNWSDILSAEQPSLAFTPEVGLTISGKITAGGKPLANAKAALLTYKGRLFTLDTITNDKGEFKFNNLSFPDSLVFVLQARKPKGGTSVRTNFDIPAPIEYLNNKQPAPFWTNIEAYMKNSKEQYQNIFSKYENDVIHIKEVEIKERHFPIIPYSANLNGPGRADYTVTAKELENKQDLFTYLGNFGRGLYLQGGTLFSKRQIPGNSTSVHIYLDGMEIDQGFANMIPIDDIAGLEVMIGPSFGAIYGVGVTDGIIEITTKRGPVGARIVNTPGLSILRPKGYTAERVFYAPKYTTEEFMLTKDLRSTIYWDANLVTNKDGVAKFSYHNADGGPVKVVIQGIDGDGNLGYGVYEYAVK